MKAFAFLLVLLSADIAFADTTMLDPSQITITQLQRGSVLDATIYTPIGEIGELFSDGTIPGVPTQAVLFEDLNPQVAAADGLIPIIVQDPGLIIELGGLSIDGLHDLVYETPVSTPEPSAAFVLVPGLLAVGLLQIRRRSSR